MKKIIIFGNSGSGKSTLAQELSQAYQLAHLDLDTIAWQPTSPPQRVPLRESARQIEQFISDHKGWVIEGCYSDLLAFAMEAAEDMIFMNLPIEQCIANAKNRPWEPHKYESKAAQDANLAMLISWIADYTKREDTFSQQAHEQLFKSFSGHKTMYVSNLREVQ